MEAIVKAGVSIQLLLELIGEPVSEDNLFVVPQEAADVARSRQH